MTQSANAPARLAVAGSIGADGFSAVRLRLAAEDLRALSWLHAAERDAATWLELAQTGFPLGLSLIDAAGAPAAAMLQSLAGLNAEVKRDRNRADALLAADYAGIYLTHGLRASPYESVWRDEDHLMLQAPTFAVREFYRKFDLAVEDWRSMADDHIAYELGFVAFALEHGHLQAARDFLDQHLMCWLPAFAERVANRADTGVYSSLAALSEEACMSLRSLLEMPAMSRTASGEPPTPDVN